MTKRKETQAERLKTWRTTKGLTQKAVASMLGVTQSSYAAYELGTRNPHTEQASKLHTVTEGAVSVFGWPERRRSKKRAA